MFNSIKAGGTGRAAALVLAHFKGQPLDGASKKRDADGSAAAALKRGEATGDLGRVVEAFPTGRGAHGRVLVVGLGAKDSFDADALRTAAAAVARRLAVTRDPSAEIDVQGALSGVRLDAERAGSAFGEGLGLVAWNADILKGAAGISNNGRPKPTLTVRSVHAAFNRGLKRGLALAEGANLTRTLSQTPPNVATPMWMAEQARKLARKTGMSCTVISGRRLKDERLTGIATVGAASENKPCLIRLEYRPKGGRAGGKPVVLIGKTMCYDSGGLSLKINNTMAGMKRDKDGGCAVLGAMHAIATTIRPKRRVVALLAAAENSISDEAYRPDDVLTFRNGVTVEVTNTDAEGRLVLADALCWACERENPECIIDLATLTGGVVIALGSTFAGLWCDDDALRARIEAASAASGERVWRLPHHAEYRDMMKSTVADILNSNPNRKAHPIQGAAFLSYFVEKGVPWAHIDIAGVHVADSDKGPFVAGPTGWGARLLAEFLDGR